MEQQRDDGPVIDDLKRLGFRLGLLDGVRNGWLLLEDSGKSRKIKIHKSGPESGSYGRHRYGIGYRDFDRVDAFVFWAKGESSLLIVPSSVLTNIFEAERYQVQINDSDQWVVNIYFDQNGKQEMLPVGCQDRNSLSEFAHRLPDHA